MKFTDILSACHKLEPLDNYKLHLASWNGFDEPLDIFLAGEFKEWQDWQSNKNFERDYIASLISLDTPNTWLFAGIFRSRGCKIERYWGKDIHDRGKKLLHYMTEEIEPYKELAGCLTVSFKRTGRQPYRLLERWADQIAVIELLPRRMEFGEFPGYHNVNISKQNLDLIIGQELGTWKGALSSVAGVYLITDKTNGKNYVGKASGEGGFWQRWGDYSATGHGGNKDLVALLKEKGSEHANNFQFTILEVVDTHASEDSIGKKEIFWMDVLCTREHGYNN